jgi:hypothetical protein
VETQEPQENLEQKSLQTVEATQIDKKELVLEKTWWLTPAEEFAYQKFLSKKLTAGSKTFPISEVTREGFFSLFLNGRTLTEIKKTNDQYSFGQIVHAAITDDWFGKRNTYIETLAQRARLRAIQTTAESLDLAADLVAVLRKQHGPGISLFLQTGKVEDLGKDFKAFSIIRELKELSELLSRLTGADQDKKVSVQGTIEHTRASDLVTQPPSSAVSSLEKLSKWAQEKKEAELKKFGG